MAATQDGQRFRITQQAILSAESGSQSEVPAEAVLPGPDANIIAASIDAVEGSLGLRVTAANTGPFLGGSNQLLNAVTELDQSKAFRLLVDQLRLTAADEIDSIVSAEDILISHIPFLSSTLLESYSAASGEPTDILEVNAQLEFEALVVSFTNLEALAAIVLDSGLEPGFIALEPSLGIEVLEILTVDEDGSAEWRMRATRDSQAVLSNSGVLNQVAGQPLLTAEQRLNKLFFLAEPATVQVNPVWWPRLPFLGFRIEVVGIEP